MKKSRFLVVVAAVLLAALSWWLVRHTGDRGATYANYGPAGAEERETVAPGRGAMRPTDNSPGMNAGAAAASSIPAPEQDWGKRLEESDDFWAFAESAIGPAKRGDGDARYRLALALYECELVYPTYFIDDPPGKPPHRRTLDEAQQRIAGQPSLHSADDLALLEQRCNRLSQAKDSPFGNGNEWEKAALAVGNPIAQAAAAVMKAIGSKYITDPQKAREAIAEIRTLSVEAARTGRPEALMHVGGAAANLVQDDLAESKRRELSWMLAGCLRTPECEGFTWWRKLRCNWDTQCQPFETPRDIIRRDAGSDFDEVERRAREINQKIDAGTLEESDI